MVWFSLVLVRGLRSCSLSLTQAVTQNGLSKQGKFRFIFDLPFARHRYAGGATEIYAGPEMANPIGSSEGAREGATAMDAGGRGETKGRQVLDSMNSTDAGERDGRYSCELRTRRSGVRITPGAPFRKSIQSLAVIRISRFLFFSHFLLDCTNSISQTPPTSAPPVRYPIRLIVATRPARAARSSSVQRENSK